MPENKISVRCKWHMTPIALLCASVFFFLNIWVQGGEYFRLQQQEADATDVATPNDVSTPIDKVHNEADFVEQHKALRLSGLRQATLGSLGAPKYLCRNEGEFCVIDNICVDVSHKKNEVWYVGQPWPENGTLPFHIEHRGQERYRINATHIADPERQVHVVDENVYLFNPMHGNRYFVWIRAFVLWNQTQHWSRDAPYHVLFLSRAGYTSRLSMEMIEALTSPGHPLLVFPHALKTARHVCFRRLVAQYEQRPTMLLYGPFSRYDDLWADPQYARLAPFDAKLRALLPRFRKHMLRAAGIEGVAMDAKRVLLITREVMGKGRQPYRRILNEESLVHIMQQAGLHVDKVDFALLSHKEQVRAVREAGLLVGMHGAGMANLVWLHDKAVVIELHPYGFQKWGYERLARYLRQPYVGWVNTHSNNSIPTAESSQYTGPEEDVDYYRHRDQIIDLGEFNATLHKALRMADVTARGSRKPRQ